MKSIWENSWFVVPALLFFAIGLALVFSMPYGYEILFFNRLRVEPLNSIFKFATLLGEAYPYVIFGVAAAFWRYRFAFLIGLVGLVMLPTAYFIKESVGSDRPITHFRSLQQEAAVITVPGVDLNVGPTSFPSGHTMAAFGLYSMLALIVGKKYRRWGLPLALLAISVGVSRVFLVQHFLADILAGAALGIGVSWLVWRLGTTPFLQKKKWLDEGFLKKKKEKEMAVKN
jgi:membrane-associated phospholipid phosphatase